jgi:phosphate transport system substrate-binding protein
LKHWTALAAAGFVAAASLVPANAADISGAGATFPYPIYAKWADAYKKETGNGLNYQSIGSGGGIKPGELTIDGSTLAKMFLGEIKSWDDPAIQKLNPKATLPKQAIAVVHRSDGSGTTYNFAYYLAEVSADWKSKVGFNTSVQWPVGIGAKGNEGVANNVAQTKGAVGYVEYAYALQNKLTYTNMINKAGKTVAPTSEAFQAAAANADWKSKPGYGVLLANQPGDKSWPMTAPTWILVYKKPVDAAATGEALKFFAWAYKNGGKMAEDLDYIPMPPTVVKLIEANWSRDVKDGSGKPIF